MSKNQNFVPNVEELEGRRVPAGNVTVALNGAGDLVVTGDVRNNDIRITETGNDFFIEGLNGTDINSAAVNITLTVARDILISMGAGSDNVSIIGDGGGTLRDLVYKGGSGTDVLDISGLALSRDFSATGRADNNVNMSHSTIGRDASFDFREANDSSVLLLSTLIERNLIYQGSPEADVLELQNGSQVSGNVQVFLGNSDSAGNRVELYSSHFAGDVDVTGGRGRDELDLDSINISGSVIFRGGKGADDVDVGIDQVGGDVSLLMGEANGAVQNVNIASNTLQGNLKITSAGDASVTIQASISGNVDIELANGDNHIKTTFATIGGNLNISTGSGKDGIDFSNLDVTGTTTMLLGAGGDRVTINASIFRSAFALNTSGGDDTVVIADQLSGVTFLGTVDGKLGLRNDILKLGETGTAIFSDVSKFDGGPDFDQATMVTINVTGTVDLVNFEA